MNANDAGKGPHWNDANYQRLRQIAYGFFRGLPESQTLQATALVHEAYLKLADYDSGVLANDAHFVSLGARTMRQVLIDYFRRSGAVKRGGAKRNITLSDAASPMTVPREDLIALDQAVGHLAEHNPRAATIVELKYFCGLTTTEVAEALSTSTASVEREWRRARAWLRMQLDVEVE